MVEEALRRTEGNKAAAARLLEISGRALWYKIKCYAP
ncbi:helix-turn-helix domain-containing protein [Thiocystis violacea]